jgi:hypothetical protein
MKGMIQLIVPAEKSAFLRKLGEEFAPHIQNTLSDNAIGHHVTLGFNPPDEYAASWEGAKEVYFVGDEIRADGEICALFGRIVVDGVERRGSFHVTLRGCVAPKESNRLLPQDAVGNFVYMTFKGEVKFIYF